MNTNDFTKIAKMVGVQGYAFMNDRAFCNCQKKKMETKESHWEAWSECWKEYKEAYNSDPEKWLATYIPLNERENIKTSETIKELVKDSLTKDVEELKSGSQYVGASIRNVLRHYAAIELKEQIEKSKKQKG